MTFAQTMRLIWIDAMLSTVGTIRRGDICRMFLITTAVASRDLAAYQAAFPAGIVYDRRAQLYRRVGTDSLFDDHARAAVAKAAQHVHYRAMRELI